MAVLGQLFAHFVGTQFLGFQRQLEAVVHTARKASGAVAEVLRGLDGDPPALPSPVFSRGCRVFVQGSAGAQRRST